MAVQNRERERQIVEKGREMGMSDEFIKQAVLRDRERTPSLKPQPKGVLEQFASGIGTALLSTARQSSDIINKVKGVIPEQVKEVLPQSFPTPLSGALDIVSKISPALFAVEKNVGREEGTLTEVPETTAGKVGYYGERVAEFVSPGTVKTVGTAIKKPLTWAAEKLYQSALKPRNIVKDGKVITSGEEIVKIGLKERVWLTKGGVERVANKIDDFETQLGDAIEAAKTKGKTIATKGLQEYLNLAKEFFKEQVDVKAAQTALEEIDTLGKNFIEKYGNKIPIEIAQKIKVSTGQFLRKYYGQLSAAGIEGQKQATRFLKEKIVEKAPQVGDINQRLSNLYKFDKALEKARGRIGNLNLLGISTKVGAAVGGVKGAAVGALVGLVDNPAIKSGTGIVLNELSKIAKKGVIPLNALLGLIRANLEEKSPP